MGVKYATLLCALLVAGCMSNSDDYAHRSAADADLKMDGLQTDISSLQNRVEQLEKRADGDEVRLSLVENAHQSLVKTVNHNANAANEDSANEMTRRGACGTEWTQSTTGQWFQTNKTCSVKDLRPMDKGDNGQ